MGKYYHFTSYNCLYGIKTNGLVPQTGFRCQSIGDDGCGVFLSKGIENSIIMYSLMLSFYNKYTGYEGDKLISENNTRIQELMQRANLCGYNKGIYDKLNCCYSKIESVNLIRNCGSFVNYLGGYGCFLSVDDVDNVDDRSPENCYCPDVIPPCKINVVNLRNKYTGEYTNFLGNVLLHFMHLCPLEEIIKIIPDENKDGIYELYKSIESINYNPNNFDLVEIPIDWYYNNNYYYYDESKIKILTR